MRFNHSAARAALFSLSLLFTSMALAAPPAPTTPVATDPTPLPLPPAPGAATTPASAPSATPAPTTNAADPFNPLNSIPTAPAVAGASTNTPAANFDPFASAAPTAPATAPTPPTASANTNAPLAIPNTPLAVLPPAIAPNPDTVVPLSAAGGTPFGNLNANLPPAPDSATEAPTNEVAPLPVAEAPKPKPKPFKPSFNTGKRAFDNGNFETARRHLLPLARRGNLEAQYLMGVIYSHDKGTLRDFQKAAFWYDKAAAKGHKEAQFNLGFLLYQGAGEAGSKKSIGVDHTQAAKYLNMAAQQNVPMAQHLLSLLHLRGSGVAMDLNAAFQLACTAADGGVDEAMFNCAMMAVRRPGTTMQDYINAYRWFTVLGQRGYPGAMENRALIARYMPANAIQYAESMAAMGHQSMPASTVPMIQPEPMPMQAPMPHSGLGMPAFNTTTMAAPTDSFTAPAGELSITRGDMFDQNRRLWVGQQQIPAPEPTWVRPNDQPMPWQPPVVTEMAPPVMAAPTMPSATAIYQPQTAQPMVPPTANWPNTGWTMGNEKLGAPQPAQPMANPSSWPWSGSNENQEKSMRQIRQREQYMLSN